MARGTPESDMARDAEYYERLSQFRVRELEGEDPRLLLADFQGRADLAWDIAMRRKERAACRNALAWERLRVTLLTEIEPKADTAPFQERISLLKSCS